jgi:hypothetical protein
LLAITLYFARGGLLYVGLLAEYMLALMLVSCHREIKRLRFRSAMRGDAEEKSETGGD